MRIILCTLLIVCYSSAQALNLEFGMARTVGEKEDVFQQDNKGYVSLGYIRAYQEVTKDGGVIIFCEHVSRFGVYDYGTNFCGWSVKFNLFR